ncbi:MAG: tetratricopeptide repeat protein [Candidatus Omnitrophica bacterium]|nr:tetratricopeptide repeat protein [Candidatus Omnitrophota bacterium]
MTDSNARYLIVTVALGCLVYWGVLSGPFVYDDTFFVRDNPHIRALSFQTVWRFFDSPAETVASVRWDDIYRPVRTLSFACDYALWGNNPAGYHLVNIVFHILNTLLIGFFFRRLFASGEVAFLSSLIFLLHPLQTEAVSWISSRADVLFVSFYMGSLLLYLRFLDDKTSGRVRGPLCLASTGVYIGSLLSKEMALTLPLVLFLYEVMFTQWRRRGGLAGILRRGASFYAASFAYVILRWFLLERVGQRGWWGQDIVLHCATIPRAFVTYLRLLLFPVGQSLIHDIPVAHAVWEPMTIFSVAGLFVAAGAVAFLWRRNRMTAAFGILWFFVTFLPASNLIPINTLVSERFLYLPVVGFAVCIGALTTAFEEKKRLSRYFFAVLLFLYGTLTILRNIDWQNEERLWRSAVAVSPNHYQAHYSLGVAYARSDKLLHAEEEYIRSLALRPDYLPAYNNLGNVYYRLGRFKMAIREFKNILQFNPRSSVAYYNLGNVYGAMGHYKKAIASFRKALSLNPEDAQCHYNLAVTLAALPEPNTVAIQYHLRRAQELGYEPPAKKQRYFKDNIMRQ